MPGPNNSGVIKEKARQRNIQRRRETDREREREGDRKWDKCGGCGVSEKETIKNPLI